MVRSTILLIFLSPVLWSQELPELNATRRQLVETLLHACVKEEGFGVTRAPEVKISVYSLRDRGPIKKLLITHPEWLKDETREALAAFWPTIHQDSEAAYVALLEEFAAAAKDDRASGLASMLKGISAKRAFRLGEAVAPFHAAVEKYLMAGEPVWAAHSLDNLGEVLTLLGAYADVIDVGYRGLEIRRNLYPSSRHPDGHEKLAHSLHHLGLAFEQQGAFAESEGYLRQALGMRRKLYPPCDCPDGHPYLAQTLDALARVQFLSGDRSEAAITMRAALVMQRKLHPASDYPKGHLNLAASLEGLGLILGARDLHQEATAALKQALEMRRGIYGTFFPNGHPDVAAALDRLGTLSLAGGATDDAHAHFEETFRIRERIYPLSRFPDGHPLLAVSRFQTGLVHEKRGETDKALRAYEDAIQRLRLPERKLPVALDEGADIASLLKTHPDTVRFLGQRAALLIRTLSPEASLSRLREADRAAALVAALNERLRREVFRREADKVHHGATVDDLLALRVGLLARLAASEKTQEPLSAAFRAIEGGRSRVFLESLGEANASRLSNLPKALQVQEETLAGQLREIEARIARLQDQPGDEPARLVRLLHVERRQKETAQQKLVAELRRDFPAYAGYRYPSACTIKEACECLNEKETAVLFTVAEEVSYALIVNRNGNLTLTRLPGSKVLNPLVATLLEPETLQRPATARADATELYRTLFGPLEHHLDGRDLVLVPDGVLHLLPFEMLHQPPREKKRGRWMIETCNIRYAPSLTALHLTRMSVKGQNRERGHSLWALGDPIFDTNNSRYKPEMESHPDLALPRGFPRLEQSGVEVNAIRAALSAPDQTVHLGEKATEASVKAASKRGDLARAKYLHFATHGIVSERSAHATGLLLSRTGNDFREELGGLNDGFLRVPEVTFLKLKADLVVLSACETAKGRRSRAEGVSGLARAFLYAGSRAVVCSLWTVDDARTAELMRELYRELNKGSPALKALRLARLKLIEDGAAPFFWAPFVYLGQ